MLQRIIAIGSLILLTNCATENFKIYCPPVVQYSLEQQQIAARALHDITETNSEEGEAILTMMADYGRLRAVLRNCNP